MATSTYTESRRKYSWWWDSHISPKNSRWLQENLTDMDAIVKQMIKVIEEDADSFARRAEMYYKKRPELMKLVEEFYRAYRALAERYDHATGVIRQAHRTMSEAFPNQVPLVLADDSPAGYASADPNPHTPEVLPLKCAAFESKELEKDAFGNSPSPTHPLERNGAFTEESDYTISSKGLKQLNDIFGSRDRPLSHAKLKEGRVRKGLNFSDAVENDQDLHENVNNNIQAQVLTESENDVKCDMEEALIKLQSEKEAGLVQYQQSLERLSNLESEIIHAQEDSRRLSERASKAETEVHSLRSTLSMLESEREASLRVSNLEKNRTTEEDFRELNERACKAESEAHSLRQELAVAEAAKDFALDQYKQSSHVISDLEHNILIIQEEVQRLHGERDISVVKLKGSEEHALLLEESNQSLQSELSSLMQQMGVQRQELIEKQEEVGSFWNCMQEEHLRFVEVETAFQTLQHLHSQSQEELKSLTSELNNKTQTLKDVETSNWSLHGEVQKIKEDNKNLNETNLSSSLTIENMQDEITRLKEIRQKLQAEVEIRLDQGNAFQQEIFSLKEELNDLTKKHMAVLEQVESIGLNPESLSLSVKALQNENSKLKESSQREHAENISLLQKVVIMENSLADLTAELEGTKEKLTALERSFQYLMIENSNLATEKEALIAQLEKSKQDMGNLEERYIEVEEKHICLEKDKKSVLHALQDLQASLCAEKEEHANFSQLAETRLAGLELQICILQEESGRRKKQVDEELDKAVNDHIEIFILVNVIVDLKEKNSSLLIDRQKLLELSKLSEKKLLELEHENDEKQAEAELLFLQVTKMRKEMAQILVAMEIDPAHTCKDSTEQDQVNMNIMGKLENIRSSFYTILKEIEELVLEKSIILTLLREMKLEAADLDIKNRSLEQQLGDRSKQLWDLMSDTHLLKEMNEKLRHRIEDGAKKEKTLNTEVKNLGAKLFELKQAHENLQGANSKVLEEKASLAKKLLNEEEEKLALEEENYSVIGEAVSLGILCFVFRASFTEKSVELKEWTQYLEELSSINSVLEERIEKMEETLETVSIKSLLLTESLEESCNELKTVKFSCDQFHDEIASCKELLRSREMELLEAEKKLRSLQDDKVELQKAMVDLERENDGVKAINQDQEKLILEISKDSDYQKNEYRFLLEMNKKLESKLMTLQEQHKDSKEREETLISELQKKRDEIEECETEASSFLRELQIYSVREVLFINKVHELSGTCHILESKSNSEGVEIILLKERLGVLEDENGMLKAQLTAYFPVVNSIRDCVASLESCSIRKLNTEFHNCDMDSELDHHLSGSACEYSENACVKVPDAVSSLQNLQTRLKAIEKVVTERMNATPKLDTTTRQTEKSKLKSAFPREDTNKGGDVISQQNSSNMPEPTTETSEAGNELLTKDIMLDQVTECSSHKIDGKVTADTDGQMFMPWEGTDQDGGIDGEDSREGKSPKNTCISSEKELGVDKLEISGQPTEHRRVGDQRKLLERLASDEQKLTNLQITVLDLKRKVDVSGKGKDLEYDDTVKEQIQEAEEGVLKLFDINAKLVKSIEADPEVSESERGGIIRKRRISEQSEKIERLQIEVQKIQFLLLQMDGKNRKKRKERTRRKTRAHLRDYLYGGRTSNNHKQKNACFLCMCSTSKRETD